jgi:hypothetical protein
VAYDVAYDIVGEWAPRPAHSNAIRLAAQLAKQTNRGRSKPLTYRTAAKRRRRGTVKESAPVSLVGIVDLVLSRLESLAQSAATRRRGRSIGRTNDGARRRLEQKDHPTAFPSDVEWRLMIRRRSARPGVGVQTPVPSQHARPLSYVAKASAASALSHLAVRATSAAFRRGAFCSKRSC